MSTHPSIYLVFMFFIGLSEAFTDELVFYIPDKSTDVLNSGIDTELKHLFRESGTRIRLVMLDQSMDLPLPSRSDLLNQMNESDRVAGLIFHFHGSIRDISYTRDFDQMRNVSSSSGDEFAKDFFANFPFERLSPSFFVHFVSCNLGCQPIFGKNFQDRFFNHVIDMIKNSSPQTASLRVSAFPHRAGALLHHGRNDVINSDLYEKFKRRHQDPEKYLDKADPFVEKYLYGDAAIDRYNSSFLRRFLSWGIVFEIQGLKGSLVVFSSIATANFFLESPIQALVIGLVIHLIGVRNGLQARAMVKVKTRTSEDKVLTERMPIRALFRRYLTRNCESFL